MQRDTVWSLIGVCVSECDCLGTQTRSGMLTNPEPAIAGRDFTYNLIYL